jgi:hypothetical protein
MNSAWIAVIGTLGGVVVTALSAVLVAWLTTRSQHLTLDRQRDHDIAEHRRAERREIFIEYLAAYSELREKVLAMHEQPRLQFSPLAENSLLRSLDLAEPTKHCVSSVALQPAKQLTTAVPTYGILPMLSAPTTLKPLITTGMRAADCDVFYEPQCNTNSDSSPAINCRSSSGANTASRTPVGLFASASTQTCRRFAFASTVDRMNPCLSQGCDEQVFESPLGHRITPRQSQRRWVCVVVDVSGQQSPSTSRHGRSSTRPLAVGRPCRPRCAKPSHPARLWGACSARRAGHPRARKCSSARPPVAVGSWCSHADSDTRRPHSAHSTIPDTR